MKPRLLRITTVPISLKLLLEGQVKFFQDQGFEVLTCSADGPEVEALKRQGIQHQVVHMTRSITPVQDIVALVRLINLMRSFKPNIVHTHTPKAGLLGMLAAWICGVPVRMHTVAGLPMMEAIGVKRWVLKVTERITYACANRVYPNSKGMLKYILSDFKSTNTPSAVEDKKPEHGKFAMIGSGSTNGIDVNYFKRSDELTLQAKVIRERYNISETTIVFSFVGRIVKDKGIVELIHAFQKLSGNAKLLLIGFFESDLDPIPEPSLSFIKNNPNVILAGFQNDIRPWVLASDVFVFPSYREGFPNVIMQAACLEVPVIASDINGCNEIIQQAETGILVPAKDTELLYNAMSTLSADEQNRVSFGKKSREHVVKNFERTHIWNELLTEYNQLLSSAQQK